MINMTGIIHIGEPIGEAKVTDISSAVAYVRPKVNILGLGNFNNRDAAYLKRCYREDFYKNLHDVLANSRSLEVKNRYINDIVRSASAYVGLDMTNRDQVALMFMNILGDRMRMMEKLITSFMNKMGAPNERVDNYSNIEIIEGAYAYSLFGNPELHSFGEVGVMKAANDSGMSIDIDGNREFNRYIHKLVMITIASYNSKKIIDRDTVFQAFYDHGLMKV
jgi:hypothetical protein